jgi:uncharacterized repeat protein (TIGR03803 family)
MKLSSRLIVIGLALVFRTSFVAAQAPQAPRFSILYDFKGGSDGEFPTGVLVRDNTNNLYGVTYLGGDFNRDGTVFKVDVKGKKTVLHTFAGKPNDGSRPWAGLSLDTAGNLYGVTIGGGTLDSGTVFKIDRNGTSTILHSFAGFSGDGNYPYGRLVLDSSGNLYGTTVAGGTSDLGAVFVVSSDGQERILHSFTGIDGSQPHAGLVRDQAGNLYGTTEQGGIHGFGTVFRIAPGGQETVLHSFSGNPDGAYPDEALVLDANGRLFGTTVYGGLVDQGTIFELDPSGAEKVLYSFSGTSDGALPSLAMIQKATGTLFGTTLQGGDHSSGVAFRVDSNGNFGLLHSFLGAQWGATPWGLIQTQGGVLYGMTKDGGANGFGTIYKIAH